MIRIIAVSAVLMSFAHAGLAQSDNQVGPMSESAEQRAIQRRWESYLEAFNKQDAEAVAAFWSPDCISTAEDSGERVKGREALRQQFATFFREAPGARLTGQITAVEMVRPDVAVIDGRTTLVVGGAEPVMTVFAATLVKDGKDWFIRSSRERDVPPPTRPYEALQELAWMIGTWRDQSEGAQIVTTVRWSPNQTFLIRSFTARIAEEERQGTQIIGWDPSSNQIRTWIFHSDGSFGQGTVSRHDEAWMLKMSQTLSDGRSAAGTQVITRIDDNTLTVQVIGETVNGEPVPTADPVTVVRTEGASEQTTDESASAAGAKP
ncbi:MAG: SgcJ/EcaC family oxidoreductase [Pirellulaceae bacterium]